VLHPVVRALAEYVFQKFGDVNFRGADHRFWFFGGLPGARQTTKTDRLRHAGTDDGIVFVK